MQSLRLGFLAGVQHYVLGRSRDDIARNSMLLKFDLIHADELDAALIADLIARELGFAGIDFTAGPYFTPAKGGKGAVQIDLLFDRADDVITVCEMKYSRHPPGIEVIDEMEKNGRKVLAKASALAGASGVEAVERMIETKGGSIADAILAEGPSTAGCVGATGCVLVERIKPDRGVVGSGAVQAHGIVAEAGVPAGRVHLKAERALKA